MTRGILEIYIINLQGKSENQTFLQTSIDIGKHVHMYAHLEESYNADQYIKKERLKHERWTPDEPVKYVDNSMLSFLPLSVDKTS